MEGNGKHRGNPPLRGVDMLLVGSTALRLRSGEDYPSLTDIDIICTKEQFKETLRLIQASRGTIVTAISISKDSGFIKYKSSLGKEARTYILDCMFAGNDSPMQRSNKEVKDHDVIAASPVVWNTPINHLPLNVARLKTLLLLKESHKYKPGFHFEKTMHQLKQIREIGLQLNSEEKEILKRREEATHKKGYSLSKKKEEFFVDNVPYEYDHDSIHEAVKMRDKPMYQYYMKDGAQVQCDKDKWDALQPIYKLQGVLEEVQVLALERAVIPFGTPPQRAFEIALEKVCTTITGGWFREFAYENYDFLKKSYSDDFVKKFGRALTEGKIKKYKSGN